MAGRSRHGPALLVGVGAAAVAAAGLAATAVRSADDAGALRPAVVAYSDSFHRLAVEAGQVVVQSIQPGIADVIAGRLPPADFQRRAAGWHGQLESIRRRAGGLTPPDDLGRAATLFDSAMRGYEAALDGFVTASAAPPAGIRAAMEAAVPTATRADAAYDQAQALITTELATVGAPTPAPLPAASP